MVRTATNAARSVEVFITVLGDAPLYAPHLRRPNDSTVVSQLDTHRLNQGLSPVKGIGTPFVLLNRRPIIGGSLHSHANARPRSYSHTAPATRITSSSRSRGCSGSDSSSPTARSADGARSGSHVANAVCRGSGTG